jgi:Fe-S-cluster containining protein
MTKDTTKNKWYIGGLHFECTQCGNCCAGPGEGYIWLTRKEIGFLAEYFKISEAEVEKKYLRLVGKRWSIRENSRTKDCLFLVPFEGARGCAIYPVRPNQCRTWPFWSSNLECPDDWNWAADTCPGINRGKLYTFEEIEAIRLQRKWWDDDTR